MTRLIAYPTVTLAILMGALVGCDNGHEMIDGNGGASGGRGGAGGAAGAGFGGGIAGTGGRASGSGGGMAGMGGGIAGANGGIVGTAGSGAGGIGGEGGGMSVAGNSGRGGSAGASAGGPGGAAGSSAGGTAGGVAGAAGSGAAGKGGTAGSSAAGGGGASGRGGFAGFGAGGHGGTAGVGGAGGFSSAGPKPDPALVGYHLVQVSAIASPLPDPTGIAADATGLWIFRGGQNPAVITLVHFDPSTGVTDRTFALGSLIDQTGSAAYGITYDGTSIWITVAGNTNKLVQVDPTTGQITRTFSSPTFLGPSDLDFDGTDLWLSTGTGMIFSIDPKTGGIRKEYASSPTSLGRDDGIAYRQGELWVGELFGGMAVQSPSTGAVLTLATHADGYAFKQQEMGPICFVGRQLVMASSYGIRTFDTVPTTPTP